VTYGLPTPELMRLFLRGILKPSKVLHLKFIEKVSYEDSDSCILSIKIEDVWWHLDR